MCFLYYFNILHLLWLIAQQHCCSGLKVEMSDLFCWFQRKWGNVRIYFHRACIRSIFTCRYLFGTANSLSWKLVATLCMLLLKEYEWYSHVQPTKQASQSSAWCHTCFVKTVMTDVCEVLTFYSAIYLCCFYYLIQSNTICMQGGFNIIYEPPGCSSESYHDDIIQTKLKSWQIFYTWNIYIYIYGLFRLTKLPNHHVFWRSKPIPQCKISKQLSVSGFAAFSPPWMPAAWVVWAWRSCILALRSVGDVMSGKSWEGIGES